MIQQDFSNLVWNMSEHLNRYALNLTKDLEASRDLLQETMTRALANREKFKRGTNLKAWLFTIMRNIFINNYRRKQKRYTIIDTTDNLYYINSSRVEKATNEVEANFVIKDAYRAIAALQDSYRIPFMMHFQGYKYQEIANDLHLPLGTVKSRIFFARKELKAKLQDYAF